MNEFMQWLTALSGRFYTAFIEGDRWKLYLQGLGITLEMTVFALIFGTILGVVVAVVRTAHDQQRPRQRNILLGILNVLCKIYTTVIRGTPMMVQILIWGFVIFASSRNKFMVGVVAGAAAGYMAVTAMYPDVARRMLRDSSRAMRSGKRMVSNMFR